MINTMFEGLLSEFQLEAKERISRVEEILLRLKDVDVYERSPLVDEAKRELHTLKGNAGMMGLKEQQTLAHEIEDDVASMNIKQIEIKDVLTKLDKLTLYLESENGQPPAWKITAQEGAASKRQNQMNGSIRVPFSALDDLVDLLAEMVIFRNRLHEAVIKGQVMESQEQAWEEVEKAQASLGKTLDFIQERIMRLRMVPLGSLFSHLKRIVHDECLREGKEAVFEAKGGDTPMDKALLEVASEALGHIIRNAVIHGIEDPEKREKTGKPRNGRIVLSASTENNEVLMNVTDDGAGIDLDLLTKEAAKEGIEIPSKESLYSLLFASGFTTKDAADISSGRGIGLSSAYEAVQRIGGSIEVLSEKTSGTSFRLRLPISVSIMQGMLLHVDGNEYVLPLNAVIESQRFHSHDGHQMNHAGVYTWRNKVIPIIDLGNTFGTYIGIREKGYVVIIEYGEKQRGLIVDDIKGIKEIVVKGLDSTVGSPQGVSGATILGDGRVLLILDPLGLVTLSPAVEAYGPNN